MDGTMKGEETPLLSPNPADSYIGGKEDAKSEKAKSKKSKAEDNGKAGADRNVKSVEPPSSPKNSKTNKQEVSSPERNRGEERSVKKKTSTKKDPESGAKKSDAPIKKKTSKKKENTDKNEEKSAEDGLPKKNPSKNKDGVKNVKEDTSAASNEIKVEKSSLEPNLTVSIPESPMSIPLPQNTSKILETPRPWETESYVSLEKHKDGRQLRFKRILLQTEMSEIGTLLKVGAESPVGQTAHPNQIFNPDDESVIDFDQYRFGYTGTTNPEGQPHGKGKMIWKDESSYEGDWINGLREGYGVMTWACGDRYEGHWERDRQKGVGTMYYASDYGPDKHYTAYEYLASKPGSVTSGPDRFEPLGKRPVDAVEADGLSTAGAQSHHDSLPEGDQRVLKQGGAEEEHRQRFPADRPVTLHDERPGGDHSNVTPGDAHAGSRVGLIANSHEDDEIASLGMESVGGGGALIVGSNINTASNNYPALGDVLSQGDNTTEVDGLSATSTAQFGHLYREDSIYDGSRVRITRSSHRSFSRDPDTWDLQHSEGNRYVGERNANFQREGHGKYRFKDGSFYDGEWKADKMHGVGWLTQPRMGAAFVIKKSDGTTVRPQSPGSPITLRRSGSPSFDASSDIPGRFSPEASPKQTSGNGINMGSTRGLPTSQPPVSPTAKMDKGNLTGDRRADSPPGRARDSGMSFNESRRIALKKEEEDTKIRRAAENAISTKESSRKDSVSPFEGMSPSERSAARRESALSGKGRSVPRAGSPSSAPDSGGVSPTTVIQSMTSPNFMSKVLEERDMKVVLRDDYKGDFFEDKKHGKGRMRYSDGSVYYGEWKRDQRHGYGEYYYANGDKYCGHWQDDLMHTPLIVKETDPDQGVYVWACGDIYKGGFAKGKKYGEGRKDYIADGSIEQGHWEYDEFKGYPFSPDLDYVGEYNMTRGSYMYGKKQGFGRKQWKDGTQRIYHGQWHCDKMHGQAYKMVNFFGLGSVFEGQVVTDGIPHGNGKMHYPNGDVYNGQWHQGKRHGKGEYQAADGAIRTGEWFKGRGMFRLGGIRIVD